MANDDGLTVYQRYYRSHLEQRRKDARERLNAWRKNNPEKYLMQRQLWVSKNRDKINANARKRNVINSHRRRGWAWKARLKKEYGLTPEQYADMLTQQEGRCAVCKTAEAGGGFGSWHIDHDHNSGMIRGLLCNRCNMALGLFRDDINRLTAAINYLEKANTSTNLRRINHV